MITNDQRRSTMRTVTLILVTKHGQYLFNNNIPYSPVILNNNHYQDSRTYTKTDRHTGRRTDSQRDGRMGRHMDSQTVSQADRQTCIHIYTYSDKAYRHTDIHMYMHAHSHIRMYT